jgi:hypothetical protein
MTEKEVFRSTIGQINNKVSIRGTYSVYKVVT